MGMKVPTYEEQIDPQYPGRPTPQVSPQTPAAFGGQQAAAIGNLGQAAANLGEVMLRHTIAKQELDDHQAVIEQAAAYKEQVTNALYGTKDATTGQVSGGLLNTRLNGARGVTKQFADQFGITASGGKNSVVGKTLGKVASDAQKRSLANSMRQDYDSALMILARHEAEQDKSAKLADFDTYFNASVNEVAGQPGTLAKNIGVVRDNMKKFVQPISGMDDTQTEQKTQEYNAKLVAAAMTPLIQGGNIAGARKVLEEHKANIPALIYNTADADLKDREFSGKMEAEWGAVKGLRLSDGMPDEAAMEQKVNALAAYTPEQKEKIWTYVRARANEQRTQITMAQNAKDQSFLDALARAKTVNEGLALLKNPAMTYSDADRYTKQQMVLKRFEPAPVKTDYSTYMSLWYKVEQGKATPAEINAAFAAGRLSQSDTIGLQKELYEFKTSPTGKMPPPVKTALDQIKIDAEAKYADKKDGMGQKLLSQYMYVMTQKAKTTQDPAELYAYAEKMKKDVVVKERWWIIPDETAPGFVAEYNKTKGQALERTKLKDIMGDVALNGLTRAGIKDYDAFLQDLAKVLPKERVPKKGLTINDIGAGTPINNAINSLVAHKKAVTAKAIQSVLLVHKDGIWR